MCEGVGAGGWVGIHSTCAQGSTQHGLRPPYLVQSFRQLLCELSFQKVGVTVVKPGGPIAMGTFRTPIKHLPCGGIGAVALAVVAAAAAVVVVAAAVVAAVDAAAAAAVAIVAAVVTAAAWCRRGTMIARAAGRA